MSSIGKHWKLSDKTKKKMSESHKGIKHTEETKKKISETDKERGIGKWMLGRKFSKETRRKMSLAAGGTGVSQEVKSYHHTKDTRYKEWRSAVFQRDNWICQTCGKRSQPGEQIYLEPHHIKGWTKYPELRYELSNGITLCKECHKLVHKKY